MKQNQQPEALALASIFEIRVKMFGEPLDNPPASRAAKELRRLHARNQELEAMLEAVGAGGVSAQRVTQAKDHIEQDLKMVAVQEPFGYFKAEPFGWRDCAETDEGAIALYEAPQPQADAPVELPEHGINTASHDGYMNGEQPMKAKSHNTYIVGVIADKIEDGTLFDSGIYRRREIAEIVRNLLSTVIEFQADALDAQRYRWLIDYFISDRVDLDDAIVAAKTSEDIAKIIDAAIAAAKGEL